jgi:hypothetical protein
LEFLLPTESENIYMDALARQDKSQEEFAQESMDEDSDRMHCLQVYECRTVLAQTAPSLLTCLGKCSRA